MTWDVDRGKRARLVCDVCGATWTSPWLSEQEQFASDDRVVTGTWKHVRNVLQDHSNVLAPDMVTFCSRGCGSAYFHDAIRELWPL